MKKTRFDLSKILMMLLLLAGVGGMIWIFVTMNTPRVTTWYEGDFYNSENKIVLKYDVLSYDEVVNGNISTVSGYAVKDSETALNNERVFKFTASFKNYNLVTDTYVVDSTAAFGTTYGSDPITIQSYLKLNVKKSAEKYAADAMYNKNMNVFGKITTSNYVENSFLAWLPNIIFFILLALGGFFLFRSLMGGAAGSNRQAMDFNKSRARRIDKSGVKFSDVAGCDEEKQEMTELVDYLKNPEKYSRNGAKLPKGVLLVGAPGTGKTLLAKAVAGEANVPFYSISGSDFVEMFVGVGAGRVRDMFKTAKQNAPCLVFIDEIDAVGRQRGAGLGGGNDEREQTLNQLLVEMDGFEDNAGILVIAATNRDDVLDPALLRAGRFDRKITVSLPDKKGREEIFKVHARKKKIDSEINFGNLAKRTVGFSGADIAAVLNDAAILSVRNNEEYITIADIDEAIDRRIAGPAKSTRSMPEFERKVSAYHEAGHAIIGLRLKDAFKVQKITIIPRGNTLGHVLMGPEIDRYSVTKKELEAQIVGYLGGRSSEEIFFDDISTGASNDIEVATRIARAMVVEYGMSSLGPIQYEKPGGNVFLGRDYTNSQKNFSSEVANEIDNEVRKIINSAHEQALALIKQNKEDVILIADTLLDKETINSEEIDYLLKNRTLEGFAKPSPIIKEKKPEQEPKVTEVPTDDENVVELKVEEPESENDGEDKKD